MRTSLSVQVVSIMGYLIGVQGEIFNREFKTSVFLSLENKPAAKVVRSLCTIRNALLRYYGSIQSYMRTNPLSNLNKMPDYIDPEVFTYLESQDIQIIKPNARIMAYLMTVNTLINERIQFCRNLFPIWTEWDYIRKLFQMPRGGNERPSKSLSMSFTKT